MAMPSGSREMGVVSCQTELVSAFFDAPFQRDLAYFQIAEYATNLPARPSAHDLGPGWSVEWSERRKCWYFFNRDTNESTWTKPAERA